MLKVSSLVKLFGLNALLLCLASASAQQTKLSIVTEHLPPLQYLNSEQRVTGLSTQIVKELMRRSDYAFDLNLHSWTRAYQLALNVENTCIYSMAKLPTREALFKWVGALVKTNSVFYALKSNKNIAIEQLDDAKQYITAVIKNDAPHIALLNQGFVEGKNLYVVHDISAMFKLLVLRESIDLIIADELTLNERLKTANLDINQIKSVFEIKDIPLELSFACNLNTRAEVVDSLTKSLTQMIADGTYDKILKNWQLDL